MPLSELASDHAAMCADLPMCVRACLMILNHLSARTLPVMELSCSFCGKRKSQVAKLVGGSGETYICDECVRLCVEILHAEGIEESLTAPEHGSVADPLLYRRLLNVQSELANMQVGLRRLRRRVSELAENVSEPRA